MRILYANKLEDATLTATTVNYNFPLGNLLVNQLALSYKATDITVDVTAVFDTAQTVNAVGVAGHNASTIRIEYYTLSTDVVPAYSHTYSSPLTTDMYYSASYNAEKVVVRFESTDIVSVGHLTVGELYQMPNPNFGYADNYTITNERTSNAFGAVYGSDGVILREISPSFSVVDDSIYKSVIQMLEALRNFGTLFVDMTEDNHSYKEPMYATFNLETFSTNRDVRRSTTSIQKHSFSITFTEVK